MISALIHVRRQMFSFSQYMEKQKKEFDKDHEIYISIYSVLSR